VVAGICRMTAGEHRDPSSPRPTWGAALIAVDRLLGRSGLVSHDGVKERRRNMKEMMRAVRAHRRGGPRELVVETVAVPSFAPNEVRVAVHAAAITFAELGWMRPGLTRRPFPRMSSLVSSSTEARR
jgi:hypothetical protein